MPNPNQTAVVHTAYDEEPPHPGDQWTRFVCVSDTHGRKFSAIPSGDVLLHAGDLSSWGYTKHLRPTLDWLKSLPHPIKPLSAKPVLSIIAGNHDVRFACPKSVVSRHGERTSWSRRCHALEVAQSVVLGNDAKEAGIIYLEHEACTITSHSERNWKIYGSPAAPEYAQGAFQYRTDAEAEEVHARIPEDTDILLTHTPPHKILDQTRKGINAGCKRLAQRMTELHACRLHVFGHIHEATGAQVISDGAINRVAVNAAMGSLGSDAKAIIVDLRN
ncbi:hypothetical protein PLEOSDRAFT_1031162 [Pleurotus ostreatus PC15]|uniref:Calcineurin-like phosphoesterase domain-containing protein n=1 Tax=Pleurotus ostreatus (strain PC15) TaxID=1137138 RepID=A0A067P0M6_PLEO1|nr:hypothetical protein PLEOSDRAFT_1031162 [Pleurotus ostreatus PC15]